MELDNEKLLLLELSKGNEKAFNKLYDVYWERLFSYVVRIVETNTEAEDVTQEVFITLWNMRKKLPVIRSLNSYLLVMARNRAVKHMLQSTNERKYLDSLAAYLDVNHENSVEQALIANDLSSFIDKEIADLPLKMQEIFILSRKQGLSNKEIAQKLTISDHTVKKQINNSIKHIRAKLDNLLSSLVMVFF